MGSHLYFDISQLTRPPKAQRSEVRGQMSAVGDRSMEWRSQDIGNTFGSGHG